MPLLEDQPRARIGILGNNEKDCTSAYDRIDFGTGGYQDDNRTCEGVVKFQVEMEIVLSVVSILDYTKFGYLTVYHIATQKCTKF